MMNKKKILSLSVIILVLINLGLLLFFYLPKSEKMPREIVIGKLNLDKNQIGKYDKIIKIHQNTVRNLDDSLRNTRNELYQLLNNNKIDTVKKALLIMKFSKYQQQIELTHFNHFLAIKNLCKKEQLADYEILTYELSKIFNNKRKQKNE